MKLTDKTLSVLFAAALLFSAGVRPAAGASEGGNALDEESAGCASCHDAYASVHRKLSVCSADDGCDHPVGADYRSLSSGNASVKPVYLLDPAIRLAYGRIACTTCHTPYGDEDRHRKLTGLRKIYPVVPDPMLVVDNRNNKLCSSCHVK